ncbi:MAG: hypothetical protein ACK5LE_02435 [Alphaproteobacteria bacterium]
MKKNLLFVGLVILSGCTVNQTAGVQSQRGGVYQVECSPLESGVCQTKAQKTCARQGKNVKVISTDTVKKYGRSSVETYAGGFENQEAAPYGGARKVQVLQAKFSCVS